MPARHFVKYTFLKVDPAWRRLDDEPRAADKREFIAACEDFSDGHLLRAFSLVGTRGDAELMLLSQAQNLERIHDLRPRAAVQDRAEAVRRIERREHADVVAVLDESLREGLDVPRDAPWIRPRVRRQNRYSHQIKW